MGFWDLIGALVIGLIVGLLARFLVPGRDPMGCLGTALLGVIGGFVGGLISRLIWGPPPAGQYFFAPGFLLSLVGAIVVLLLFRAIRRRSP
jgi:uncharacterized membrane protein YeaQ/YmgE (transglycosylase-associated protein family)